MVALDPHHEPDVIYENLSHFLETDDRSSQVVRITFGDTPLDFQYVDRGSQNLTSFFTAAVPKDSLAPRFTGFGVSRTLDTNALHFADPSLALAPDMFIAWYTGSVEHPLEGIIPQIIRHYQPETAPGRTVLFGGSAGGFASLINGFDLPGSVSVAANPQTNLSKYNLPLVRKWLEVCWNIDADDVDQALKELSLRTSAVELYAHGSPNTVVYMQNSQDRTHVRPHFEPFIDAVKENPGIRYILGEWGQGHKAPPKELIVHTLDLAITEPWDSSAWSEAGYRKAQQAY